MIKYYKFEEFKSEGQDALRIPGSLYFAVKVGRNVWNCLHRKTGSLACQVRNNEVRSWLIGNAKSQDIDPTEVY